MNGLWNMLSAVSGWGIIIGFLISVKALISKDWKQLSMSIVYIFGSLFLTILFYSIDTGNWTLLIASVALVVVILVLIILFVAVRHVFSNDPIQGIDQPEESVDKPKGLYQLTDDGELEKLPVDDFDHLKLQN